jgi:hypothetical protein
MSANIRRGGLALLAFLAALLIIGGYANTASAMTTGGLDHPYLPNAAPYQSTSTAGCDLGYFYTDAATTVPDGTTVTCQPFASDFDQNAAVYYSLTDTTCRDGYQLEAAGDGYSSPHYILCWPFASLGDLQATPYQTTKDVGCAPGYFIAPWSPDPSDPAAACFVAADTDAPVPPGCALTMTPDNKMVPCIVRADGTVGLQYPPAGPGRGFAIAGSATPESTLYVTGSFPPGVTLTYQWNVDGSPIAGATGNRYFVPNTVTGRVITATVHASGATYQAWSGTTGGMRIWPARLGNTRRSYIAGAVRTNARVWAADGIFYRVGTPQRVVGAHVTYRWYLNGHPIAGGTHSTIAISRAWRGRILSVRIYGAKFGFYGWASSSAGYRIR